MTKIENVIIKPDT